MKVKRIIPEIFDSYYTSTIRKLSESFSENGEYYFKYNIKACKLYLFTDSKHVTIDVNNDIDNNFIVIFPDIVEFEDEIQRKERIRYFAGRGDEATLQFNNRVIAWSPKPQEFERWILQAIRYADRK